MNVKKVVRIAAKFLRKNAPFIFAGASGVCTVLAVKSAIDETNEIKDKEEPEILDYKKTMIFTAASLGCMSASGVISYKRQKQFIDQIKAISSSYTEALALAGGAELLARHDQNTPEIVEEGILENDLDEATLYNVFGHWLRAYPDDMHNAIEDCNDAFATHGELTLDQIFYTVGADAPEGTEGTGWMLLDEFYDYNGHFNLGLRIAREPKTTDDGLEYYDIYTSSVFPVYDSKGVPILDNANHTVDTDMPQFFEDLLWSPKYIFY